MRVLLIGISFFIGVGLFSLDLSLAEAGKRALEVSPDIREMSAQIYGASVNYQRGIRAYFPQVKFTGTQSNQVRVESADSRQILLGAQLNQPLYNGGRVRTGRRIDRINISLQQQQLLRQEDELLDRVWDLYYGILLEEKKNVLYQRTMDITQQQLDISKVQVDLGELTELDYLEASLQASNLALRLSEQERTLNQQRFQLRQLLQVDMDTELNLEDSLNWDYEGIIITSSSQELYELALNHNLDVIRSDFELTRQRTQFEMSRRTYLPEIELSGKFQLSDDDLPLQHYNYSLSLDITFPFQNLPVTASFGYSKTPDKEFGTTGSQTANVPDDFSYLIDNQVTALSLEMAQQRIHSSREELKLNIDFFLESLEDAKRSLVLQREELDIQKRRTHLMKIQLDLGEAKLLDYLEAEMELAEMEQKLLESILGLKKKERELEKLLGLTIGEMVMDYGF